MGEVRQVLAVAAIGLGCALALAATHRWTEGPIARNETAAERAVLTSLLGAAANGEGPLPDLSNAPAAWHFCGTHRFLLGRSDAAGYGGSIRLLYTMEAGDPGTPASPPGWRLVRLRLLGHQETPGISDFLRGPGWLRSLEGLSPAGLVKADAVSGATVTSRAVTRTLAAALAAPEDTLGVPLTLGCPS